ncbi:hypothetical protein GUITHDRAFT_152359 [Guillardia theta CCMP2712]|uniref:Uncharacterized protein n=1 Tax=Guillardia theta (strain CCMP2712) TaxID=905079 RepID=L1JE92_GUITC|nr:hypothetical protein GUITHDRAFT_152359 [Guillardia theta CCMP2712]EKX46459.1 hypothetical protein GUITHDRAFT_152359 [Guillardia theta CCMP2712]|eukprot:XP_005833439.1 hypothetical protein GUITHDRAFT_152359 [Guillardia theta CCMP2712]
MFALVRQTVELLQQSLVVSDNCTHQSSGGLLYGAICYDVGGCCPTEQSQQLSKSSGGSLAA